jgi:hypothetical protein
MNTTLKTKLTQFWHHIQSELFEFLSNMDITLTPRQQELVTVLEMLEIEGFVPPAQGIGRPLKDRVALARGFVAKAVLNLPTTEALIDRLKVDLSLRRLCGFSVTHPIPGKHRFSRAFAEFAAFGLAEKCHVALIKTHLGDQLIGHVARDSTAIEVREKAQLAEAKPTTEAIAPRHAKRGRPCKGELRTPKPPSRLEQQQNQSVQQMIAALPTACDVGSKRDSKGHKYSWRGYKLHIDTGDGDIPLNAILTSASVHDSQVALPLMKSTSERVTYLYDLADAAYCSPIIRQASLALNHVPLIDHNRRRGFKNEFDPHEAQRYKARSQVERTNAQLKDSYGGRSVWVRGHAKVYTHLMLGIAVIAALQILRLIV